MYLSFIGYVVCRGMGINMEACRKSVSYTHLDVYKRQLDVFAILEYAIVDCGHPVGDFDSAWHIESCESIITDGFQSFWHFSVHFGQIILICRSMTYVERVSPDFFQVGWKRGLQLCGSVKSPFTD